LPNIFMDSGSLLPSFQKQASGFQNLLELPLRGKLGDHLENWEMTRKIARLSNQPGFGEETVFNAKICQGNFHHHCKRTHEMYQQKLSHLHNNSPLPAGPSLTGRGC
ncbi:MAG: hypothetical protein L6Q49_22755, partial [Anaerolineales bacterium]|nr:hypothetical protein [Anaerolineales bacterium]